MGAGLAIPDFPLTYGRLIPPYFTAPITAHYVHRVGAIITSAVIVWLVIRVLRGHRGDTLLTRPAHLLSGLLVLQLFLGALTIWTQRAVIPVASRPGRLPASSRPACRFAPCNTA